MHTSPVLAVYTLYLSDVTAALSPCITSYILFWESKEVGKGNQCFANRSGGEVADRNSVVKIGHLEKKKKTTTPLSSRGQRRCRTANSQNDSCEVDVIKWRLYKERVWHWYTFLIKSEKTQTPCASWTMWSTWILSWVCLCRSLTQLASFLAFQTGGKIIVLTSHL